MKQFKNILCVIEGQSAKPDSLTWAVALAKSNQAKLTVVTVTESGNDPGAFNLHERLTAAQLNYLQTLVEPYTNHIDIHTKVLQGTFFLAVVREVLRNDHDLVMKCPEPPAWLNRFFSSNDMHLLRKCPCPLWMVKPQAEQSYHRILAAVDVDDRYPTEELDTRRRLNQTVMQLAGSLALSEFAQLHVVHVWNAAGESAMRHGAFKSQPQDKVERYLEELRQQQAHCLDKMMDNARNQLGADTMDYLKPRLHLLKGTAHEQIPTLAKDLHVDCVVMGTVARTGIRGFIMSNTAETILEQINCSVLAVKPEGFVTPVTLQN